MTYGGGAVLSVELARIHSKERRTAMYSIIASVQQVGYTLGMKPIHHNLYPSQQIVYAGYFMLVYTYFLVTTTTQVQDLICS